MSNIEWTDTTWQVTTGCRKVSPGCANCYAETMANRLAGMARADAAAGRNPGAKSFYLPVLTDGRWNGVVTTRPDALEEPLHWKKPRRVFVNSMSDLFHEAVPFDFIDRVFAVMALCPQHTFQVLTKRPERMAEYLNNPGRLTTVAQAMAMGGHGEASMRLGLPLPNVWLGTSCENQAAADERVPHLLKCPAALRFLSCEPLLGPIDLRPWIDANLDLAVKDIIDTLKTGRPTASAICVDSPIHWAIVGGESGPGARPCDVGWVREIVEQCKESGVACFVKQLGAKPIYTTMKRYGGQPNVLHSDGDPLKDPKGGDPAEWPADLRVRQFPEVALGRP